MRANVLPPGALQPVSYTHLQLLERFEIQCRKHVYNYPFLMGQGVWLDSEKLGWNDEVREVLKHGTLSVGFIGLAETLTALIGEHHAPVSYTHLDVYKRQIIPSCVNSIMRLATV